MPGGCRILPSDQLNICGQWEVNEITGVVRAERIARPLLHIFYLAI